MRPRKNGFTRPGIPLRHFLYLPLTGTIPEKYQLEALQPITMTLHVNDLRIAEEIRPIFDSTHNDYSAQALTDLLAKPLSTKKEIWHRQDILKGFIANKDVWKDYSFYRFRPVGCVRVFRYDICRFRITKKAVDGNSFFRKKQGSKKRAN
jgi:hypothetical protein